jgi:hypothetical protein
LSLLHDISRQLAAAGYVQTSDGTFAAPDGRRSVVLMDAEQDPARWPSQVATALTAPGLQQTPAWGRYVVLIYAFEATDNLRASAAAFARDVTKCRRLIVFPSGQGDGTLPFLPLRVGPVRSSDIPEADTSEIIERHLGPDLSGFFEDPDTTHAAVEREIERLANE